MDATRRPDRLFRDEADDEEEEDEGGGAFRDCGDLGDLGDDELTPQCPSSFRAAMAAPTMPACEASLPRTSSTESCTMLQERRTM